MAKVEGLNLRGSRWYLRIIIPDDLIKVYGTTRKNVSLGTSDRKVAVVAATVKRAEWLADFEHKRREQNLTPVDAVSPELSDMLAEMGRAQVLAADDELPWIRACRYRSAYQTQSTVSPDPTLSTPQVY